MKENYCRVRLDKRDRQEVIDEYGSVQKFVNKMIDIKKSNDLGNMLPKNLHDAYRAFQDCWNARHDQRKPISMRSLSESIMIACNVKEKTARDKIFSLARFGVLRYRMGMYDGAVWMIESDKTTSIQNINPSKEGGRSSGTGSLL